jgi:hypothetical protein
LVVSNKQQRSAHMYVMERLKLGPCGTAILESSRQGIEDSQEYVLDVGGDDHNLL